MRDWQANTPVLAWNAATTEAMDLMLERYS
jgi:hypothetical protein